MARQNKFGTFSGVFTPSILTILGVIMYLRLPMIVGQAGLLATIGIILVAHIISVTTGLSVSAIATDKKVEAGGTYYMISRSLGLPIGGTLGIALFVGLSFSVSLYLIGFSESFLSYWGWEPTINNIRLTGSAILMAVTILTFLSTSLAIKTQYFIMAAIVISLISVFVGHQTTVPAVALPTNPVSPVPLMVLFGIFFPAVTGFEAGVSMSGDLQDPKKSIPKGTILAVTVGFFVYIGLTYFLSTTVNHEMLAGDPGVLLKISWIPELVVAGIWGATLSSALGSILGAPRILQATAADAITPRFFAKGFGPTNEPRNALLLTFLIAEAGILIGELNVIARVVSIFFITTYGFLNTSAAFEYWTSADFRPEFRVPGWVSALGAIACFIVMIQLDFLAMIGAVLILSLLFLYLKRKELTLASGDAWSGVWASLVRKGLSRLKAGKLPDRNWRPNIIMFSGNPDMRSHMVEMGKAISGKLGILSAFELVESPENKISRIRPVPDKEKNMTGYFHHSMNCTDIFKGMDEVSRIYGFSGVEPNTILMGWSHNEKTKDKFIGTIRNFESQGYNSLFLNYDTGKKYGSQSTIDIWWSGSGRNLSFAIYLIRHITYSRLWRSAKIRLLLINPVNENHEIIYKSINAILDNYRVEATIEVIDNQFQDLTENEIIGSASGKTDLVILGVPDRKFRQIDQYFQQITDLIVTLGSVLVINASDNFENLDVMRTSSDQQYLDQVSDITRVKLPPLDLAGHPEIAGVVRNADIQTRHNIEAYYTKTFKTLYVDRLQMIDNLNDIMQYMRREIQAIKKIKESFRQKKAIDKIKNDTLFKIRKEISEELKKVKLPVYIDQIRDGNSWYVDQVKKNVMQYPKILDVTYTREEFAVRPGDSVQIKWYKRLKKFKHRIRKSPIRRRIHFRQAASFFLHEMRLSGLLHSLKLFREHEEAFHISLRKLLNKMTGYLDEIERVVLEQTKEWKKIDLINELGKECEILRQNQEKQMKIHLDNLEIECRNDLRIMNEDLECLNVSSILKKKKISRKKNRFIKKEIYEFDEAYHVLFENQLNKILMELALNTVKNRLETMHRNFNARLVHNMNQYYIRSLEKFQQEIKSYPEQKILSSDADLHSGFEVEMMDNFDHTMARMRDLVFQLTDTYEIYSGRKVQNNDVAEIITVPLERMTEHFLETRYITSLEKQFEDLIDQVKNSILNVQDAINLTKFNLENFAASNGEDLNEVLEFGNEKIKQEKDLVTGELDRYIQFANENVEKAFEPLSPTKIEESTEQFTSTLRSYQGKRVISGVSSITSRIISFYQNIVTKLLYIQSEGILLSKRYKEDRSLRSTLSNLLDLKEKVNPSMEVLRALPQYYVNLFNGKSSINENFWVMREDEELKFSRALERYQNGHRGGIMLLGERNMGKTAFSKYLSKKFLKNKAIYSLFPSLSGNSHENEFSEIFSKATQIPGTIFQIAGKLTEGSVVIINDIELFWEKSSGGTENIQGIKKLIDDFSYKLLVIVNLNPHAYKIINQLTGFGSHFIEIINIKPFDAEDLKELIMRRHRSSGLSFGYTRQQEEMNEIRMAHLFNAYFNYSLGNPGTALNAWLAHIREVDNDNLNIRRPEIPSLSVLKSLDETWILMLNLFVLHKRMDKDKIMRITGWDADNTHELCLAMLRSGIIIEKASGIYIIDPYLQPFISKTLADMGVL